MATEYQLPYTGEEFGKKLNKLDNCLTAENINVSNGENINQVGTPEVIKTEENGNVNFTFNYLKGEPGEKGEQGEVGPQGVGISKSEINTDGELILTYTDETTTNLG